MLLLLSGWSVRRKYCFPFHDLLTKQAHLHLHFAFCFTVMPVPRLRLGRIGLRCRHDLLPGKVLLLQRAALKQKRLAGQEVVTTAEPDGSPTASATRAR